MENFQIGDPVTYRREGEPRVCRGKFAGPGSDAVVVETTDRTKIMVPSDRVWKPVR